MAICIIKTLGGQSAVQQVRYATRADRSLPRLQ
jgi:hypothetical protein